MPLPVPAQAVAASPGPQPASIPQGSATVYLLYRKNACLGKGSYSLDGGKFRLREEECIKKVVPSGNRTIRDEYTKFTIPYQALPGGIYYFDATGACPINAANTRNGVLYQLPQTPPPAWAATCQDFSQAGK
jgi:hypothetical protein